ncbi:hypothetical protein [Alteromonas sp. S015]|uniref:hypothetical protein n=1 Tax=Alteromonas sp. S015 TaxID=3117401 RepID=UPI002FDF934B
MQVTSSVDRIVTSAQVVATESAERALSVENDLTGNNSQSRDLERSNQFQILSDWALSAELNRRVAMTEHTEQAIRRIYAQIESIRRELSQATNSNVSSEQTSSIAREVWEIESTLASSGLSSQLSLASNSVHTAKLSEQIDLLSQRSQGERLQVLLGRSGRAVNLLIPPGQDADTTFSALESAFHRHGVSLGRETNGQLTFSVPQEHSQILREPWSFLGSGIRVAAGNPVSIELAPQQSEMRQLLESVGNNVAREHYINELEARQQRLRATLAELRNERTVLLEQLKKLEMDTVDTGTAVAIARVLRAQMSSGAASQMPLIMAQSGIHAGLVRYGLG